MSEKTIQELTSPEHFGNRNLAFKFISDKLLKLNRPVTIVETGCIRPPREEGHEWEDGESTLLWDAIAQHTGGHCYSVDKNRHAAEYARARVSKSTTVYHMDSIKFLNKYQCAPIDLLYLDSMDIDDGQWAVPALHHAAELSLARPHLAEHALIAIDDCQAFIGKHALVKVWLELFCNLNPSFVGYIQCWQKR